jgi:poly(3-hydroxybutyrate) depolymerase
MAQSTRDVPSKPHLFWLRSWLHQRPDFGRRECFIEFLFKENLSAEGKFRALGEMLSLESVKCPIYLLAGESDDITTKEQVFAAEGLVGTSAEKIEKRLVPGGHIGLFMGTRTLKEAWPEIARWIAEAGSP